MKRLLTVLLVAAVGNNVVHAATINWTNIAGGNWSVATNWSPNQVPGSSDNAVITNNGSYTVTLDTSPTVASLTLGGASGTQTLTNAGNTLTLNNASVVNTNGVFALGGGSISGSGLLTVSGQFNWTSGSIASGSTLTVGTSGLLVLAGNNGSDYDMKGILTNAGTVRLASGNIRLYGGGANGQLINLPGALVDLQADISIDRVFGGEVLANYGTVRKSGGTGTNTINPIFNNFGLLDVQTGTVSINGGDSTNSVGVFQTEAGATLKFVNNFTANSGVQFAGVGTNSITGGTFTFNGLVTISNLVLAGATLTGSNGVVAGVLAWTSGSIASGSTLTVGTNGLLVLAGNNGSDYDMKGILTNAGTVRLASGNIRLYGGGANGQLINLPGALVDLQADISIDRVFGGEVLVNYGTVRKSGGTGTSTINPVLNNSGLVDAQTGTININGGGNSVGIFEADAGATLKLSGGTFTLNSPQFTGTGTNLITGGTLTLSGFLTSSNPVLVTGGTLALNGLVTISNLTLAGSATLAGTNGMIAGALTWTGGSIGSGSTLTVATNGTLALAGNNGSDYEMLGILTNAGTVRLVSGNLRLRGNNCTAGAIGELINLPGALLDLQTNLNIDSCGGTELLVNQGTVRKSGGTGTSTIYPILNNTATGVVDAQTGTININGGDTTGSTGVFQSEAGATLAFVNNFTAYSEVQFTGVGTNSITGGTFTLNGLVTISNLTLAGSATLAGTNGIIAGALTWTGGSIGLGSTLTVATNGTLVLAGNNGTDYPLLGILTNAGTVKLVSGNLYFRGAICNVGAIGELINLPGALLDLQTNLNIDACSSTELLVNYGTVRKSGGTGTSTIHPTFNNNGTLDVQTGTVALNGSYTLAGGTLNFGISSLASYGKINLSGSPAKLAGSVSANLNNGFVPATNNSFTVLTYGSHTGGFTNTGLPAVVFWQTDYGPTSFAITVVGVSGFVFTTQPVGGMFTNQILAPVVVQIVSLGNPLATNGVPVTLSMNSGSGTMNGTLIQNTDPTGKATFSDLSFNLIGTKTIRASSPGWVTATSAAFAIVPLIGAQWTDNGFVLSLNGSNSPLSTILSASTNLVSWTPIYTNAPTNGAIIFLDPASKTFPYRFYSILQR